MHIIEISITEQCNNKCLYCVARNRLQVPGDEIDRSKGREQKDIDIEKLQKWLVFQKKNMEDMRIIITGGEPTTCNQWIELLQWIKRNNFNTPIIYTNGYNIKNLFQDPEPNKLAKVILTHHGNEQQTRLYVQILKELRMNFICKILGCKDADFEALRTFGKSLECKVKYEGIKDIEDNMQTKLNNLNGKNILKGESPYHWRWNGYGDKIDNDRTKWRPAYIISVVPSGEIYNCHHFDTSMGNISEHKELKELLMAPCVYLDTYKLHTTGFSGETRCEIMHYVNLFEEAETKKEEYVYGW